MFHQDHPHQCLVEKLKDAIMRLQNEVIQVAELYIRSPLIGTVEFTHTSCGVP